MNGQKTDLLSSAIFKTIAGAPVWTVRQVSAAVDKLATMDSATVARWFEPDTVLRVASAAQARTAEGLRILASPSVAATALVEVQNKAEVYLLVRGNRQVLGIPSPPPLPFPLETYLNRAYERDAYAALWAIEGLGNILGESHLGAGQIPPTGVLRTAAVQTLPENSLLMLHAGMGLAFAQRLLAALSQRPSAAACQEVAKQFADLCRRNSKPGYEGAAVESLGLVTRTFHGALVRDIDRAITDTHPDLRGYFWHGVGRALYFLPVNFLPCSTWETVLMCEREGIDEFSRVNLFAGVGWAIVMVNIRSPEVLANLVVRPHGARLFGNCGFRNGIASSLIMRQETTPEAPFIGSFLDYSNGWCRADERQLWDALIRCPGEEAIQRIGPALKTRHSLDQIFQYTELFGPAGY